MQLVPSVMQKPFAQSPAASQVAPAPTAPVNAVKHACATVSAVPHGALATAPTQLDATWAIERLAAGGDGSVEDRVIDPAAVVGDAKRGERGECVALALILLGGADLAAAGLILAESAFELLLGIRERGDRLAATRSVAPAGSLGAARSGPAAKQESDGDSCRPPEVTPVRVEAHHGHPLGGTSGSWNPRKIGARNTAGSPPM
jgi:hypothetical protein